MIAEGEYNSGSYYSGYEKFIEDHWAKPENWAEKELETENQKPRTIIPLSEVEFLKVQYYKNWFTIIIMLRTISVEIRLLLILHLICLVWH